MSTQNPIPELKLSEDDDSGNESGSMHHIARSIIKLTESRTPDRTLLTSGSEETSKCGVISIEEYYRTQARKFYQSACTEAKAKNLNQKQLNGFIEAVNHAIKHLSSLKYFYDDDKLNMANFHVALATAFIIQNSPDTLSEANSRLTKATDWMPRDNNQLNDSKWRKIARTYNFLSDKHLKNSNNRAACHAANHAKTSLEYIPSERRTPNDKRRKAQYEMHYRELLLKFQPTFSSSNSNTHGWWKSPKRDPNDTKTGSNKAENSRFSTYLQIK